MTMLRHSDLPSRMSATHDDVQVSVPDSIQARIVARTHRLLARTLTAASLLSALVVVHATAAPAAIVHAAPAAPFALAGAAGMRGPIGGVEESRMIEHEQRAGHDRTIVFQAPSTPVTTARVAVAIANVRSGPGLDYARIGKLPGGIVVTLLERNADWFRIRSPAGAVGWVVRDVLAIDGQSATDVVSSTPSAKPLALQAMTTEGEVNLRGGPGKTYASLGKLPKGLTITLLSRQDRWYQVKTPAGVLGWITADYLKLAAGVAEQVPTASVGGVTPAIAPAAAVESVPTGVVNNGKSNLRAGPGTAFASLGQLAGKSILTLIARHGDWLKVRTAKGTVGWISGTLLTVSASALQRVPVTNDVPATPAQPAAAPAPAATTSNRWVWPTRGRITSGYGWRWGTLHNGLDTANAKWTPIVAARAGTVIEAGWCSGYGWCVKINHGDGLVTEYGHMAARPNVRAGQRVTAGTRIGSMGSTYDRAGGGYSTGVHLHFTVKSYGRAINPLKYLP